MSTYTIECSFTPLCTSCGQELVVSITEARCTGHPLERDNPYERKDRRVFVEACSKCFVHRNDIEEPRPNGQ